MLHADTPGETCPECGSNNATAQGVSISENILSRAYWCPDCDNSFTQTQDE